LSSELERRLGPIRIIFCSADDYDNAQEQYVVGTIFTPSCDISTQYPAVQESA